MQSLHRTSVNSQVETILIRLSNWVVCMSTIICKCIALAQTSFFNSVSNTSSYNVHFLQNTKKGIDYLIKPKQIVLTLPIIGMSTDPQVSAPQCTIPDAKSAVTIPRTDKTGSGRVSLDIIKWRRPGQSNIKNRK